MRAPPQTRSLTGPNLHHKSRIRYRLLEKFEVSVKDAELVRLSNLRGEWAAYRRTLVDAGVRLQKAKTEFKDELLTSLTDFNNNVVAMRAEFLRTAPFDAEVAPNRATELIAEFREQAGGVRSKESELRSGLEIFAIDPPANKETAQTERDLELLDGVWTMLAEWTAHMDTWKFGKFREIDVGACHLMAIRRRPDDRLITYSKRITT